MKLLVAFFLFSILLNCCFAYESADSFIVRLYDDRVKVLAPKKRGSKVSIIVENKTLVKVLGKVVVGDDKVLKYMPIPINKYDSVSIDKNIKGRLFFIPMSPSFQRVELIFGRKPYQIPPVK